MTLSARTRVLKFGGSLFETDAMQRLPAWLAEQTPMRNLLVVGGGAMADVVRQFDKKFGLDEETAHHLCIDAMAITARLTVESLPHAHLVGDLDTDVVLNDNPKSIGVVDIRAVLNGSSRLASEVPTSWDVTSDSLAALVAIMAEATELVLLKSCLPDAHDDVEEWSAVGYVDRFFPHLAAKLPTIRCVNGRDGFVAAAVT